MVKITDYNDANLETISVTYFWGSCHSADCQQQYTGTCRNRMCPKHRRTAAFLEI